MTAHYAVLEGESGYQFIYTKSLKVVKKVYNGFEVLFDQFDYFVV